MIAIIMPLPFFQLPVFLCNIRIRRIQYDKYARRRNWDKLPWWAFSHDRALFFFLVLKMTVFFLDVPFVCEIFTVYMINYRQYSILSGYPIGDR